LKDIGFCFGSALFAQARKYPRWEFFFLNLIFLCANLILLFLFVNQSCKKSNDEIWCKASEKNKYELVIQFFNTICP
jgi:hypothetical protein